MIVAFSHDSFQLGYRWCSSEKPCANVCPGWVVKLLCSLGIVENFVLQGEIYFEGTCYRLDQYVVLDRDGFDIT